jgi:hypothetical protein
MRKKKRQATPQDDHVRHTATSPGMAYSDPVCDSDRIKISHTRTTILARKSLGNPKSKTIKTS